MPQFFDTEELAMIIKALSSYQHNSQYRAVYEKALALSGDAHPDARSDAKQQPGRRGRVAAPRGRTPGY